MIELPEVLMTEFYRNFFFTFASSSADQYRFVLVRGRSKHHHQARQRGAEASARHKELDDVHGAI